MFKNLRQARNNPKDEFYTHLIDIEKELSNYKEQLKNKVIYCNTSLQAQLKPVNWCKGIKIDDNESKLTSTYEEADTVEDYEGAKHYVYTKDGELIEFWVSSYGKIYTIHSQVI
ncbi:MAG: adenine-specific methyltransferase EcoRI family protein [Selenomonadaceae bacterium]|nr:adenine-specific methyltransferase EcoRI family protein [Selenomonadaceae bacterium]